MNTAHCDVLVIGGGPGGSTTAALLVEKGYSVTLLEKAHHPRFHIGESLLPANMPLLEKLGVADEVRAIGMEKYGADFYAPWQEEKQTYEFAGGINPRLPMAYQVERASFDNILIKNAARRGVNVVEGCQAKRVEFLPDDQGVRVFAEHNDGEQTTWQARYLVDASGRETLLGNQLKLKSRSEEHNSVALYGHFRNAKRSEGREEGKIGIYWFNHGWFWFIPLIDGVTSVGMVTWPYFMKTRQGKNLEQFFMDGVKQLPALHARLAEAQLQAPVTATGNFSYSSKRCYGKNYMLVGDAFAFIDPIFSSGVWLAMHSGERAAETIDAVLGRSPQAAQMLKQYERDIINGPKQFSWFIYRSSNPALRQMFMSPSDKFQMRAGILSLLAGDIFDETPIWRSLRAFKISYYLILLSNWKRTRAEQKRRKMLIQRDAEIESSVTSA